MHQINPKIGLGWGAIWVLASLILIPIPQACAGSPPGHGPPAAVPSQEALKNKILAELFLSRDHQERADQIKEELRSASITRTRIQFVRLGNPPQNLAIGRNVPAWVARSAIRLAIRYNGGIQFLLPQLLFFPDYIAIGSSAFDEASNIPIGPEGLEQLSDPALSTQEFHELYRRLTGETNRPRTP